MGTNYRETWHNLPLTRRVQLAEMKYNLAKSLLDEARLRLRDYKEELTPADSYKPMHKGSPNLKFIDEFTQKMVVRDYLDAFKNYMIAKQEYERLLAALKKQQTSAGPKRPSLCPRGAPEGTPRGPVGIIPQSPPEPESKTQPSSIVVEPTKKGIKKALLEAEKKMLANEDDPQVQSLLKAASKAADKMLEKSIDEVNANPSEKTLRVMFGDLAASQLLGSEQEERLTDEAMKAAVKATKIIKGKTEKEFRRVPTKENFKKLLNKMALHQSVGGSDEDPLHGVNRLLPPGKYTVIPGDSLSKISEKYYGNPGYWDVIYLSNFGLIGNNPDVIRPDITLDIP
ncbi:MAG: LysM peptidoglycan-binding domain-containing protein [Phycisphaerae bacterium]